MSNVAPVKWAQRKETLYVTISLPDVTNAKLDLTDNSVVFSGTSSGKSYNLNLELFKEIDSEGSVWNVLPSSIQMKLNKKDKDTDFWPRLLQDKTLEKTNVKIDWDRYVDEDEGDGDFDMNNLAGGNQFGGGMPGMGGMGGMPGMGGMGGMGGMADMFSGMGGMGGMGGMDQFGGDDEGEGDSDDGEDLPDLEATEAEADAN